MGTEEGGVTAPAITPEHLFTRADSAYTDKTLALAIREGRTPKPGTLGFMMPRFRLDAGATSDLIAYLHCLGHDSDPGVSGDAIRLGAALPLSGRFAAAGAELRAVLLGSLADVNAQGGIFQRRLELLVEDSAPERGGEDAAVKRLIDQDVFALVGGVWSGSSGAKELLRAEELAVVGPVGAMDERGELTIDALARTVTSAAEGEVFHLQPGPDVLARVAVKHLSDERAKAGEARRVRSIHARDEAGVRWAEGARVEAARRGIDWREGAVFEHGAFDARACADAAREEGMGAILFSGSAKELWACARALGQGSALRIYAPFAVMVGANELAEEAAQQVVFVYPGLVGEELDAGLRGFASFLRKHDIARGQVAFQASAYVSAKLVVEALKRTGARPTRQGFVAVLEGLRDFDSGVLPALSYGKNRRVGVMGARLVRVTAGGETVLPASGWIEVTP